MNAKLWNIYLQQLRDGNRSSLRKEVIESQQKVKNKGFGFHAGGSNASSVLIVEKIIHNLAGITTGMSWKGIDMEEMNQEERQERKLFELGMEFIEAAKTCDVPLGQAYIDAGYPVNFIDTRVGGTALHHAAANSAREFVRMLLKSEKCDYLIKDNDGRTAYLVANRYGQDIPVEYVLLRKSIRQAEERGLDFYEDVQPPVPRYFASSLDI
ncbi:MAG: ankyrin repeat domain-containing protein [gamma proteobacterium endosymbiont of Lamellibrachia anaximandri]|nr:ankyrin repeat domain-containing protein [gamma proteobacterium endosymbiont of Lamellibrachia anaximandri]